MSLDRIETARTAAELRAHAEATGLSAHDLATWLSLRPAEVEGVLAMDGSADPATVWLVRDALDQAAREAGVDAGRWSVLTDASRRKAQGWFRLRQVPPRP